MPFHFEKNKIQSIAKEEKEMLLEELQNRGVYIVELFGKEIDTKKKYMETISVLLNFPKWDNSYYFSLDAYLDWMTDTYLTKDFSAIAIFINDYSEFLRAEPDSKRNIMEIFDDILYFWDDEVERVVVGGTKKEYNIYLVD